ncbi:MAG TPA: methyltransferase domain-containing protein [Solirubrobacteraceae bacterium]|nr:methyltransferase domain-containing protein [Solirubrobacteraceae bacterium]
MTARDPKKFDPARAHLLDAPERERFLPTGALVALLELRGGETVVDYGAGTGRVAVAVADVLHDEGGDGHVIAVDESPEMFARLQAAAAGRRLIEPVLIDDNVVPYPDRVADRVLAVNVLHEMRGERALSEIHRLLKPGGFALVVDWERGRERDAGPPDELLYDAAEATTLLRDAGFAVRPADAALPYHFALRAAVGGEGV